MGTKIDKIMRLPTIPSENSNIRLKTFNLFIYNKVYTQKLIILSPIFLSHIYSLIISKLEIIFNIYHKKYRK